MLIAQVPADPELAATRACNSRAIALHLEGIARAAA
jgi:hypothetical protein